VAPFSVLICLYVLSCVCVVQSKKPQKPRATADRIRQRARQARVSKVRFISCPLFCVSLRGCPFAAHIYTRRRARFAIRRNTYFRRVRQGKAPRQGRKQGPANQSPATQGKEGSEEREETANPSKQRGRKRKGNPGNLGSTSAGFRHVGNRGMG
jgi:hypothetical protein